ncbi:zinc finger protein OZF-like isoform X2 [Trichoplusia ni]|uniref:Zinc finger protein OZF-like isoform X2 n=1 Tax=Trichoplusia ni TaxID=7111 RepID=A0A7E5X5U6_TRINI|nr:zinc finger protein OZF-like isoform X2 [Trichoplusia ni]
MASILHIDVLEYNPEENISYLSKSCICCTSQNGVFIDLKTCKHTSFFDNYMKFKLPINNVNICNICHSMLKKFELFKQQVEESVALLLDQTPILKITKLHNFQTCLEIDGKTQPDEQQIKTEQIDTDLDLSMDIKVEHDSSDFEEEATLKKKSAVEEKYEGKIKVVILSTEEVIEEREAMAKKENYLKLPFKCEDCIVGFDHENTLKNHIENRHKKKKNSFQCDICKTVLGSKHSFNDHINRHGRSSNRTYRYHLDKHKSKQECKICGSTFVSSSGLKVHMHTVHNQSPRIYSCDRCNKSYRVRSYLAAHMRAAHSHSRAFCVVCKTHYKTPQGLAHHVATHSAHVGENGKRFICDECGAKFGKKYDLQIHINWEHLKIIKHRCNKCSKVFKSNSALTRHVNFVHFKKRPPRNKICDYCGRAFTTQTMLKFHIRTHTGERPLQCSHCSATFAHSAALYTHNKLLHPANK